MRPSAVLCGRIKNRVRFTTKNVAKGFYRGTGTGALGAHTRFGNYLIDWRKVRHFVVPNLKETPLTPFVSGNIYKDAELPLDPSGNTYDPGRLDGTRYLNWWRQRNQTEYDYFQQLDEEQEQHNVEAQTEAPTEAEPRTESVMTTSQQDKVPAR